MKARPSSIAGIQIMRGIAALMVVLRHTGEAIAGAGGTHPVVVSPLVELGAAGVDVFFVISGFIMVYISSGKFGVPNAGGKFLLKRAERIVPLYWVITTLAVVLWAAGARNTHWSVGDLMCSYTFIPCVRPHGDILSTHPIVDPGWTLTYEVYFYLAFAAWLTFGSLRSLLIGLTLFFIGITALNARLDPQMSGVTFLADPLVFEFCFGMLLGTLYLKGYIPSLRTGMVFVVIGIGALLASSLMPTFAPRCILWGTPCALMVCGALSLKSSSSVLSRLFIALGDASYSLYLIHGFVTIAAARALRSGRVAGLPQGVLTVVICGTCVIAGFVTYSLIETPIANILGRRKKIISAIPQSGVIAPDKAY